MTKSVTVSMSLALILAVSACQKEPDSAQAETQRPEGTKLAEYGVLPEFTFTDCKGRAFTRRDLLGKVWVVDFVFTRCAGPCPRMTGDMRKLTEMLKDEADVRFLSISVDPEFDTPERLLRYAEQFQADLSRWYFVTGDKAATYSLVKKNFFLKVDDPIDSDQVIHDTRFVIVNRKVTVCAYHDADPTASYNAESNPLERVASDVRLALRQSNDSTSN